MRRKCLSVDIIIVSMGFLFSCYAFNLICHMVFVLSTILHVYSFCSNIYFNIFFIADLVFFSMVLSTGSKSTHVRSHRTYIVKDVYHRHMMSIEQIKSKKKNGKRTHTHYCSNIRALYVLCSKNDVNKSKA